jgi:hypothetical protein
MSLNSVFEVKIIDSGGITRYLELCVGDIADTSSSGPVDLLAISAFHEDYWPVPNTVVRRLLDLGVDVAREAGRKARDWRQNWHCWISSELAVDTGGIRRLICFEHGQSQDGAVKVVGNVFRSVSEFVLERAAPPMDIFRLPLLSAGSQGADKVEMMTALIRQAYTHLKMGLPVKRVQLVLFDRELMLHTLLATAGAAMESCAPQWHQASLAGHQGLAFDYFLSYRRPDRPMIESLVSSLSRRKPGLKLFIDQNNIKPGDFWKPEIVHAMSNSRQVVCLITDSYPDSPECMDEFHSALCHGLSRKGFVLPLLSLSAKSIDELPSTVRQINGIDARCPPREFDEVADAVLKARQNPGPRTHC